MLVQHLRALLFDKRVYNKWSFEELPQVQRIMNTVEKTATGITPAELILNNSLRLTKSIFIEPSTMDRSRLKSMSGQLAKSNIHDGILGEMGRFHGSRLVGAICGTQTGREIA